MTAADDAGARQRRFDFIVAGTGRSGTSAVARYLSAAEGVHCSLELFGPGTDHSTLHPPGCYHDLTLDPPPRGLRRARPALLRVSTAEIARRGDTLRFFGNKTPNYIFRLKGLLDEIAPGKGVVCWRDVKSVALSFARRADDPEDDWDPGKRALFAVSDSMTCLRALAALGSHDVMIMPNRAVIADWEGATRHALSWLLPDLGPARFDPVNLAAIDDRLVKSKSHSAPQNAPSFTEAETRAITAFEATGADALLNRDRPFLLSEVRDEVAALAAALPTDQVSFMRGLVREDGRPITRKFFRKWQGVIERNEGREARVRKDKPSRPDRPPRPDRPARPDRPRRADKAAR
ncbi:MAG: sulfotransferase [Paracoccaceae bacterium]|nr:MAG: sulfotransferase [Paracoccaceae bacterium]